MDKTGIIGDQHRRDEDYTVQLWKQWPLETGISPLQGFGGEEVLKP